MTERKEKQTAIQIFKKKKHPQAIAMGEKKKHMGVSENSVPLHPMVLLIIIPIKWL